MRNENQNPIQCAQFEALLTDALDGTLAADAAARFHQHRVACPNCALMFDEAQSGMALLRSLSEADAPANLVHNILVATSGARVEETAGAEPARTGARKWFARVRPFFAPVLRPRFAMSAAMAFCSLSVVLSLSGVKLKNLSAADFTPSALRDTAVRAYEETSARAHRYWDNLRFVYEVESRVRELKNAPPQQEEQPAPAPQQQQQNDQQKKEKDNGADKQEHRDRQYVQRNSRVIEARLISPPPVWNDERRAA
jgi:hypothetical protein